MPGAGVEIVGIHATPEIRSGSVSRPSTRRVKVLGTYPSGSRIEYVAHGGLRHGG